MDGKEESAKGLSVGALVGIIIGSAVATIVVAFLAFWCAACTGLISFSCWFKKKPIIKMKAMEPGDDEE